MRRALVLLIPALLAVPAAAQPVDSKLGDPKLERFRAL